MCPSILKKDGYVNASAMGSDTYLTYGLAIATSKSLYDSGVGVYCTANNVLLNRKAGLLKAPSEFMIFIDAKKIDYATEGLVGLSHSSGANYIGPVHNKMVNMLMGDGHACSIRYNTIPTDNSGIWTIQNND